MNERCFLETPGGLRTRLCLPAGVKREVSRGPREPPGLQKRLLLALRSKGIAHHPDAAAAAAVPAAAALPFDVKRKIAQNRDKPWRGNPDYSFIGKIGAEAIFIVNWAKLYLEDRGDAALALLFSMSLGWLLLVGAIALIFGFDLTRLISIKYQMVILLVIWAYVGIKKKPA